MEYGKWELRNDASYYFSKDTMIWPSSNALDEGKLNTEENLRNIYRDLTTRNFAIKYNYFSLTINPSRNGVFVSPGEAIIQGYHFYTKNSIEVKVPDNRVRNEDGSYKQGPIVQYTLGISLAYDAANHVTGDVVNKEGAVGESEALSGVYLKWFDECQLECNYDNILVLGRAWVKDAMIVKDCSTVDGRIIYHGFEQDPFKDHRFNADVVEVEIHGHATTHYDTLRDNMTQIHEPLYTYDTMHFPIELDRSDRTKAPSFVTDIQDFVNHIPDWYTSKYGDYMTGALRFNNLSIDAMRELTNKSGNADKNIFIKDSLNNEYQDSVIISPRTYGDLVRHDSDTLTDIDYNVGGTIMTIVPGSYPNTTDHNNGYTGIHAALVSQRYGDTGLKIHTGAGNETNMYGYTRLVHYNTLDIGTIYDKNNVNTSNTSKFIIENVSDTGRKSSIDMKDGEIFIDSYQSLAHNTIFNDNLNELTGIHRGSGIQLYTGSVSSNQNRNIDFRVDEYDISVALHNSKNHRTGTRGEVQFKVSLGATDDANITYNNNKRLYDYDVSLNESTSDPYMTLGNLRIRSNSINDSNYSVKQNTIEVINTGNDSYFLPYIRLKPRVYSEQYLAESSIQVGTTTINDYYGNNAEDSTMNTIILKRVGEDDSNAFTYLEQDFKLSNGEETGSCKIFNKWIPPINNVDIMLNTPNYNEIAGMYSAGNIGCSTGWLSVRGNSESMNRGNNPYTDDKEWVRFTRFRYDNDKDEINGGTFSGNHDNNSGRLWGSTYNLEFNTNVANKRANQIIWRFNGSTGSSTNLNGEFDDTLKNVPPVVLSYIHDSTEEEGIPTRYTNINDSEGYNNGKGTFETYIDHNGNTHYNPTNKIRDFLLLENAGLSIAGDINNPSWCGDTLNSNSHLGVTIMQGRVYNAVYNDFAETFEKSKVEEIAKPGTLISLDVDTGKYKICEEFNNNLIVGVQSNTYAYLAGGNRINGTQDILDLENEYFTVAVSGKVWVNVIKDSFIKPGDLLCSSFEKGRACKSNHNVPGTIIGKALSEPKYFENDDEYKVLILVMTM